MNIRVVIEYDKVTNSYSAVCPELPGCTSCGNTEDEAKINIKDAIELYLEPDSKKISKNAKVFKIAV